MPTNTIFDTVHDTAWKIDRVTSELVREVDLAMEWVEKERQRLFESAAAGRSETYPHIDKLLAVSSDVQHIDNLYSCEALPSSIISRISGGSRASYAVYGRFARVYGGKRLRNARMGNSFLAMNYINVDRDLAWVCVQVFGTTTGEVDEVERAGTPLSRIENEAIKREVKMRRRSRREKEINRLTHDRKGNATSDYIEVFGSRPCLHRGSPTKMAQVLLKGLTTPIPGGFQRPMYSLSGQERSFMRRPNRGRTDTPFGLVSLGLMERVKPIPGRRQTSAQTTYYGYALLKHWADRNKEFAKFFDAYRQRVDERKLKVDAMIEKVEG